MIFTYSKVTEVWLWLRLKVLFFLLFQTLNVLICVFVINCKTAGKYNKTSYRN